MSTPKCVIIVLLAPSSQLQLASTLNREELETLLDAAWNNNSDDNTIVSLPVINDKGQEGVTKFKVHPMLSYTIVELITSSRLEIAQLIPPTDISTRRNK